MKNRASGVLFALSAVVWAVQSVNFLDLIVEDGHSVALYIKYSSLNVVKILTEGSITTSGSACTMMTTCILMSTCLGKNFGDPRTRGLG